MQELREHGAEAPHRAQWSKGKSGRIQGGGGDRKANARWKRQCRPKAEKTEHNRPERDQRCQGITGTVPQMKP